MLQEGEREKLRKGKARSRRTLLCVCMCAVYCLYYLWCVHLSVYASNTHHAQMTILSNTRKTTATDTDMAITAVMAVKQEEKRNTIFM